MNRIRDTWRVLTGKAAATGRHDRAERSSAWSAAWREGHAHGLASGLGITYREAWLRTAGMLAGSPAEQSETTTGGVK